jgi:2',3'-cyclic-nucleotide 2'-phosphodiesterase (5'-nucleotidase family)
MIEKIRQENRAVLLVDTGDSIIAKTDYPKLRAEAVLAGMGLMKYDAVNVGEGEFSMGTDFLSKMEDRTHLPFVLANMDDRDGKTGWIRPYIIKEYNGFRVGIVGISANIFFDTVALSKQEIRLESPLEVLRNLLPRLRKKVDVVVLLSHLGYKGTTDLLRYSGIKGIDVAVVGHGRRLIEKPEEINGALLVMSSMSGEYLGKLTLEVGKGGLIAQYANEIIALTRDVPEDKKALKIMEDFKEKKAEAQEKAAEEKKRREEKSAQMKLLKMTPEQFLKTMKKRNAETSASGSYTTPPLSQ